MNRDTNVQGGEKERVGSQNNGEFSSSFPKQCALRNREGKRLVEKGEETVNRVVNGKMKKHTKKNLTIFTIFLGVDTRKIDDSCLTYIML